MNSRMPVKMFRSVFTRLLVVILITGILINLLVFGFFRHYIRNVGAPVYGQNFIQYARFLVRDLGLPPSQVRATEIADRLGLVITYRGPAGNWSTAGGNSESTDFQWTSAESTYREDGAWIESRRGRHRVILQQPDGGVYSVSGRRIAHVAEDHGLALVVLLVLLSLFLGAGYLVLRRILAPVRALSEGVRAVSKGNLDHRVPKKGMDELAELADSFNVMTERVGDMIQTREQLLLDVSHELRTPITRMKVAAEFLEAGRARESILEDLAELESMVTEILETARLRSAGADSLKLVRTDLAALLRSTAAPFADQHPGMDLTEVEDAVFAKVDPHRMEIVFRNLFSNAQKFSTHVSEPVRVTLRKLEDQAVVEVVDHGVGMPETEIPHIFEPFYRTDKSRTRGTGGFGLGLSLCKTVMDAHGGRIEITSRVDVGTTVRLSIPL